MGQRADADPIHARGGDIAHGGQVNAARRFEEDAGSHGVASPDALAQLDSSRDGLKVRAVFVVRMPFGDRLLA